MQTASFRFKLESATYDANCYFTSLSNIFFYLERNIRMLVDFKARQVFLGH